ncbi:hypothetical protein KC19_VG195900 [Ceratodon purpureus]|uniref:Uncharacterized protein n=1 Tax=Ceratodon purpureus TaxID=3225 RepID=A0A8T0HSZ0_CERPU|nr:hypothetical protein KC19_VG195900 [Ceratodon purpureus]
MEACQRDWALQCGIVRRFGCVFGGVRLELLGGAPNLLPDLRLLQTQVPSELGLPHVGRFPAVDKMCGGNSDVDDTLSPGFGKLLLLAATKVSNQSVVAFRVTPIDQSSGRVAAACSIQIQFAALSLCRAGLLYSQGIGAPHLRMWIGFRAHRGGMS